MYIKEKIKLKCDSIWSLHHFGSWWFLETGFSIMGCWHSWGIYESNHCWLEGSCVHQKITGRIIGRLRKWTGAEGTRWSGTQSWVIWLEQCACLVSTRCTLSPWLSFPCRYSAGWGPPPPPAAVESMLCNTVWVSFLSRLKALSGMLLNGDLRSHACSLTVRNLGNKCLLFLASLVGGKNLPPAKSHELGTFSNRRLFVLSSIV